MHGIVRSERNITITSFNDLKKLINRAAKINKQLEGIPLGSCTPRHQTLLLSAPRALSSPSSASSFALFLVTKLCLVTPLL
jgi:hypothetical protein